MSDLSYRHVVVGEGSVTIAYTANKDTKQFVYGISLRSPLDSLHKKKGNMIAKNRLETYMFADDWRAEKLEKNGKAGSFISTAGDMKTAVDELVGKVMSNLPSVRWLTEQSEPSA